MADIVSDLASKCGITTDAAQKGLGILLGFLKSKLPADAFNKVSSAVPKADSMISAVTDTAGQASGGMLDAVKGAVGKLFGGGDAVAALTSQFSKLGMTPDQVMGFIPQALECLKGKLPANIQEQISSLLPVHEEAAH